MKKTMKRVLLVSLIVLVMTPLRANAFSWGDFFRALFGLSTATSVETLKEDISETYTEVKKDIVTADAKTEEAFLNISKALSSEKDYAAIKSNLASAKAKTKANEKTDALNKLYSDYTTYLKNSKLEMILIMKTMTESEQNTLIKNINTLSEQGQRYYELNSKAKLATSRAGKKSYEDADLNSTIANTKAIEAQLENKAKTVSSLANQAKILGALAGLKF